MPASHICRQLLATLTLPLPPSLPPPFRCMLPPPLRTLLLMPPCFFAFASGAPAAIVNRVTDTFADADTISSPMLMLRIRRYCCYATMRHAWRYAPCYHAYCHAMLDNTSITTRVRYVYAMSARVRRASAHYVIERGAHARCKEQDIYTSSIFS